MVKKEGPYKEYYENGKIKITRVESEKVINYKKYDKNGKIIEDIIYEKLISLE